MGDNQASGYENYDGFGRAGTMKSSTSNGSNAGEKDYTPVIHSLEELKLVPWAYWDETPKSFDDTTLRTLVIKPRGLSITLVLSAAFFCFFSALLVAVIVGGYEEYMYRSHGLKEAVVPVLFVLVFWVFCFFFTRFGIQAVLSKTWIDIRRETLTIGHGIFRSGRQRVFARVPETEVKSKRTADVFGTVVYEVSVENGDKTWTSKGCKSSDADRVAVMIKTIRKAEL